MESEPPFQETYKTLLENSQLNNNDHDDELSIIEDCDLPLINLNRLSSNDPLEREKCMHEITHAASVWGFFQVINHGISEQVIKNLEYEQKKVFHQPFQKKIQSNFLSGTPNSYRWGNPKATCLKQLSWSEAFHISLTDVATMNQCKNLRYSTCIHFLLTALYICIYH